MTIPPMVGFLASLQLCFGGLVTVANEPGEIEGHRTIHGAQRSAAPNPIQVRKPWGKDRDLSARPLNMAVFLVEFSDVKHAEPHSRDFYDLMLFSRGKYKETPEGKPVFGSLNDWYDFQSRGLCQFKGRVFDWVAVDDTFEAIHQLKGQEARDRLLIRAVDKVKARDGLNLDDFDALLFIHSGPITGPPGNILWSHRFYVLGKSDIITGEIEANGVLCHEFGHLLGLPDLYSSKTRAGIGPCGAMSGGYRGKYPGSFCAWSKIRIGWCNPTVIDAATPQKLVLRPIQSNPDDAFIIPLHADGSEFLLLENRGATGCDEERQAGLLIWRIARTLDKNGKDSHTLRLIGPEDASEKDMKLRQVTWPAKDAPELLVRPDEGKQIPAVIRNIRREGELVFFEIGAAKADESGAQVPASTRNGQPVEFPAKKEIP